MNRLGEFSFPFFNNCAAGVQSVFSSIHLNSLKSLNCLFGTINATCLPRGGLFHGVMGRAIMEPNIEENNKKLNELWNEKWQLLEQKMQVDMERSLRWTKFKIPNPALDQKRRELHQKLNQLDEEIYQSINEDNINFQWFEF